MASLSDLPVEIIDCVCLYLRHLGSARYNTTEYTPAARKGLVSLCRTSKKFHSIALAHLYHHVNINDNEARLVPFARTLFENQTLADLVHEFDLEQCFNLTIDPVLEDHFLCHPATSMPSGRFHLNSWITHYAGNHAIRAMEILFIRMRKLRSIDFVAQNRFFANEVFTPIKEKHLHDLEFHNYFKTVTLRCQDVNEPIDLSSFIPRISSTSIRKLTVFCCVNTEGYPNCELPSLLEVRLLNSVLTPSDFVSLVDWCPNLELLRYELGKNFEGTYYSNMASSMEIIEAIAPLYETLETLILYQKYEQVVWNAPIDPLTNFTKLKNLVIGFHDLTGDPEMCEYEDSDDESYSTEEDMVWYDLSCMDNLPESLENLCIIDSRPSLNDGLLELGKVAKDQYPYLKSVIVDESFDLRSLFADLDINYQEVYHNTLMGNSQGLEDFVRKCWRQLDEDCGSRSRQGIAFNKFYTEPILPYCISSADQADAQLGRGSRKTKKVA